MTVLEVAVSMLSTLQHLMIEKAPITFSRAHHNADYKQTEGVLTPCFQECI